MVIQKKLQQTLLKLGPKKTHKYKATITTLAVCSALYITFLIYSSPSISPVSLQYSKGLIGQTFIVTGSKPIPAHWVAEINRAGTPICSGDGFNSYEPRGKEKIIWFKVDQWVGDKCPVLKKGDLATATWTFRNLIGIPITVSDSVVID